MRPPDAEGVEQAADVLHRPILGIGAGIGGHVGGRIAARVEGDGAIAAGEEAHLEMPALVVARELVDEDEGGALPHLLVEEADAVDARGGHEGRSVLPKLREAPIASRANAVSTRSA